MNAVEKSSLKAVWFGLWPVHVNFRSEKVGQNSVGPFQLAQGVIQKLSVETWTTTESMAGSYSGWESKAVSFIESAWTVLVSWAVFTRQSVWPPSNWRCRYWSLGRPDKYSKCGVLLWSCWAGVSYPWLQAQVCMESCFCCWEGRIRSRFDFAFASF